MGLDLENSWILSAWVKTGVIETECCSVCAVLN